MSQKNSAKVDTYVAGKNSINKALDFLKFEKQNKNDKLKKEDNKYKKVVQNCTSSVAHLRRNRRTSSIGFSLSFIALQMRACAMHQDWLNLQRLIPLLLDYSTDRESILWRFTLIMLLNSPESHDANILEFLEKCIGISTEIESPEPEQCLQQLLTIQSKPGS